MHTKSKEQERTRNVICAQSHCQQAWQNLHKHVNETRAGAVNSDSRSRLNAPTDAAAPGRAFPASWQVLQVPLQHQRQHTELDNTNTLDKEDKARAECESLHCCVLDGAPCCQGACKQDQG